MAGIGVRGGGDAHAALTVKRRQAQVPGLVW